MSDNLDKNTEDSWFAEIEYLPRNELYSIIEQFKSDGYNYKLDLSFSYYKDEYGIPWTLSTVKTAEHVIVKDGSLTKDYLDVFGYESFNTAAIRLLLGQSSRARIENRAFAIQTISVAGALRTGAEFLVRCLGMKTVYSTQQTMEFIDSIFLSAGFKEYKELRYFTHYMTLDMPGMLQDLAQAKEKSVVILQVSGHNPTGYDPSLLDWEQIADIVTYRNLFPFFYSPCQGFATGDVEQDVAAVRLFEQRGIEFLCAQSFSSNFGLYNERVGCLSICVNDINKVNPIKSHLEFIVRNTYSTPPSYGARIIAFILGDRMLVEQWKETMAAIAERLKRMRSYLREELERLGTPGTWQHITNQVGMFCLTGLNEIQAEHMKKQYHIYILSNGRMNVSGLNPDNVQCVAKAIHETLNIIPLRFVM